MKTLLIFDEDIDKLKAGFPKRLKTLMDALGCDQITFARRIGVTQAALSQILNGKRSPSIKTLIAISLKTGASIDRLLGVF